LERPKTDEAIKMHCGALLLVLTLGLLVSAWDNETITITTVEEEEAGGG